MEALLRCPAPARAFSGNHCCSSRRAAPARCSLSRARRPSLQRAVRRPVLVRASADGGEASSSGASSLP
jgi:hypothetical protein